MNEQNKALPVKLIATIVGAIFLGLVLIFGILPAFFDVNLFQSQLMSEEQTPLKQAGITVPKDLKKGEYLYTQYCESCHGGLGLGNGPTSRALRGKVPSFQNESTLWKNGVSNQDSVIKTLSEGIEGTEMPQFKYLSDANLLELARFTVFLASSNTAK
jgi:hypothetical protein